jgi:hypothetical protein
MWKKGWKNVDGPSPEAWSGLLPLAPFDDPKDSLTEDKLN